MLLFPNAKINLGLYVTGVRSDGYHDISTVMVPIGWCDVLEVIPAASRTELTTWGREIACPPEKNLIIKAYNALSAFIGGLPPVSFYLQKVIPDGAGLGGGSADAAFALRGLNEIFHLGLSDKILAQVAATIGADCPFFIYNRPALCEGIGDRISHDVRPSVADKSILIAKRPGSAISTREAYEGVKVKKSGIDLRTAVAQAPDLWLNSVKNDFEDSIFPTHPEIRTLKELMLSEGAEYASMTGSGAAVFGIFNSANLAQEVADKIGHCDKFVTSMLSVND